MNATLLCLTLMVPGYGEKDIIQRIKDAGGVVSYQKSRGRNVTLLNLLGTNTDAYLCELCELPNVVYLDVSYSTVTDDCLRTVSQLLKLQCLVLNGTRISDKGLRHLESMKELKELYLDGCHDVTAEGVARL